MSEETYKFTRRQLNSLLDATIEMFFEYRDVHDKPEVSAKFAAIQEMMEGLDADKELVAMGEKPLNLQVHD